MTERRAIAARDQQVSAFAATLMRLCDATGAVAAALVDGEGETVDYAAGSNDPFDIKVAAAEWMIVFALLKSSRVAAVERTDELFLRGRRKSFFIRGLGNGYGIVIQLMPRSFTVSRRGVSEAARELCREAGFDVPVSFRRGGEHWSRVDVRCSPREARRPDAVWMGGTWSEIEILGRWTTRAPREDGYRARLPSGAEMTLVRESLGRWYADL